MSRFHPRLSWSVTLSLLIALLLIAASVAVPHAGAGARTANTWTVAASMSAMRGGPTATVLPSGTVLVAAGGNSSGSLASGELFDPTANSWSSTGSMSDARGFHTATLLPNDKVLVAGGVAPGIAGGTILSSAELYDPSANTWSSAGSMQAHRFAHTATLLPNGKVLVAGGNDPQALASAELYDPSTNSWSGAGSMSTAHSRHTATLLPTGKVLVVGGCNTNQCASPLASAELYDPSANAWSSAGVMSSPRASHTATPLPSGKVLASGGLASSVPGFTWTASADLYDPSTNSWSGAGSMSTARWRHTATLLPNRMVLVAGGENSCSDTFCPGLASAELYDPSTNTWSSAGSMSTAREYHTASLLLNGRVLIAGGCTGFPCSTGLASAELYDSGSLPIFAPALSAVAEGSEVTEFFRTTDSELGFRATSGGTFRFATLLVAFGVASRPKAVLVGTDLYVFYRASTNELQYVKRSGGLWGNVQNLGGQIVGDPAAAVDGAGTLIVSVLNWQGNVFVNRLPSSGTWSGFQALDGILSGRLELASYNGDVYLFGINPGGVLWERQWNRTASAWGSWTSLDGVLSSAPSAIAFGSSLYVFASNPGGVLWYRALSGGIWGGWTSLDGVLAGDPDIAATSSTLLVFGTNPAGALFDRRNSGGWGAWDPLDGVLQTGPEVVTAGTQTYVFAINGAGNTWYRVWNGSAFGPWQNLGGIAAIE